MITIFFLKINFKPKFIIPENKKNRLTQTIFQSVVSILIFILIVLPLDIGRVIDKKIIKEKTLNIQILLDVSLSMSANDIPPNRFFSAKKSILELLKNLEGYNISLIIFSAKPFVYSPFSIETKAIISKFSDTNLVDFPPIDDFA